MSESKKKPGVAFWATVVVVVVPLFYVLSFGPACWLAYRDALSMRWTGIVFHPLVVAAIDGPQPIRRVLAGYAELFAPPWKAEWIDNIYRPLIHMSFDILQEVRDAAN